jgi:hypothetical protein
MDKIDDKNLLRPQFRHLLLVQSKPPSSSTGSRGKSILVVFSTAAPALLP